MKLARSLALIGWGQAVAAGIALLNGPMSAASLFASAIGIGVVAGACWLAAREEPKA